MQCDVAVSEVERAADEDAALSMYPEGAERERPDPREFEDTRAWEHLWEMRDLWRDD